MVAEVILSTWCIDSALWNYFMVLFWKNSGQQALLTMEKNFRDAMPVLARHNGEWTGDYIYFSAQGKILDRYKSHLICRITGGEKYPYYQQNTYTWNDGRTEQFELHATYKQARIWFDTDRIQGSCWEIDAKTLMLNWIRKDIPKSYFYEMIQINEASDARSRVWHWFENDVLVKRVCINETKVIT